jgi:predicted secreted protein
MRAIFVLAIIGLFSLSSAANIVITHEQLNSDDIIYCHLGDQIEIALESNPSTGFVWEIDQDESNSDSLRLQFQGYRYKSNPNPLGLSGLGGVQTLNFTVSKIGAYKEVLHLRRGEDEELYSLIVRINCRVEDESSSEDISASDSRSASVEASYSRSASVEASDSRSASVEASDSRSASVEASDSRSASVEASESIHISESEKRNHKLMFLNH